MEQKQRNLFQSSSNSASSDNPSGFNPMRWDCEKRGCFNIKRRPKIEEFAGCFPGQISFGDVDGIVEINGKGLMLEWKTSNGKLPMGQRIMYERLSKSGLMTIIVIVGNAETMECSEFAFFHLGRFHGFKKGDLSKIKEVIKAWVKKTKPG
ncbi:MAG TPA: hypothetical protein ENI06_01315 [Spirochaetales bacterium]|nr:hypothetical protein [Spirochaetales bacterium]